MAREVKEKEPNPTKTRWSIEKVIVPLGVAIIGAIVTIVGFVLGDDPSVSTCVAGDTQTCPCENGRGTGIQKCSDDGARWLACQCPHNGCQSY